MAKTRQSLRRARRPVRALRTLSDLRPDPENARVHPQRNLDQIGASLDEAGAWRSIGIDEKGVVYMGNGVVQAANGKKLKLKVVDAEGDELVAVRRVGLTAKQKQRAALADNRTSELSEWDLETLRRADRATLASMFDDDELARLLKPVTGPGAFSEPDADLPTDYKCPKCSYEWSGKPKGA